MRFATSNIEWCDGLFDDAGQFLEDGAGSPRRDGVAALEGFAPGARGWDFAMTPGRRSRR